MTNTTIQDQVKMSIVMTVHNRAEYLKEALDSVFAQSFLEIEVICVDDASDDKNIKYILQDYQARYENMKVIRLENNVGAGKARNIGFSKVQGEYTIFLDSDDVFAGDFLKKMYCSIYENKADVCICGYKTFCIKNGEVRLDSGWKPDEKNMNSDHNEKWLLDIPLVAWNKLCRTEFLKENHIFFQSLTTCNDIYFSCRVMINAAKRCYIEGSTFISYRTHTEKQLSAARNPLDLYKAMELLLETERNYDNYHLLLQWTGALLLRNGIWESKRCNNEKFKYEYYRLIGEFFNKNKIHFRNELLEACAEKVRSLPYENSWFSDGMDYLEQLRLTGKKLKEKLNGEKQLFLWGLGMKGAAFQQFCREQNIMLKGVADIKNCDIGIITEYGNQIVDTEYVLQKDGFIIASNKEIFESLEDRNLKLLNLDELYLF